MCQRIVDKFLGYHFFIERIFTLALASLKFSEFPEKCLQTGSELILLLATINM